MSVAVEDVIEVGKLITVDQALEVISSTEPLSEYEFAIDGTDKVHFTMPDGWADKVAGEPSTALTDCSVSINHGDDIPLTLEALLKMTSSVGMTKDFVTRTPGKYVEPVLNYHVVNQGIKQTEGMRLLAKDGIGQAFIKSSLTTFPNLPVIDRVVGQIKDRFGTDEIYVDYKLAHSLERTALRFVLPSYVRTIDSARNSTSKPDNWSLGIQLTNSIMASPETKLSVSGYLFAWWCTNGAISTHATSGNYNRRVNGQELDEVLEWVGNSTHSIFGDLDHELDAIEELTQVQLQGEINDVVQDVFKQFKIPKGMHQTILNNLIDSTDLTGYGLMQAITQSANEIDVTDGVREKIMTVGGAMGSTLTDRCSSCHRVNIG